MNRETTTRAYDDESRFVLQIEAGGTGATNVIDAAINLGAISSDNLGQPSGVASLAANVKVPLSQLPYLPGNELPSINGPSSVSAYEIVEYLITNFDSQTTYNISANHGNVLLNGDRFLYSAGGYVGIDVITINAKVFGISVSADVAQKPHIVTPTQNGSILITDLVVLNAEDVTNDIDIITSVDWEITILNGQPINHHSAGSAGVEFVIPNLIRNKAYTLRARITSQLLGVSLWSDPVNFSTINLGSDLTQTLFDPTVFGPSDGDARGSVFELSSDGNVLAISYTDAAMVEIYKKINNVWTHQTNISVDDIVGLINFTPSNLFAVAIAISHDGNRVYISDYKGASTDTGLQNRSGVCVFKTTIDNDYTTYAMETYIEPAIQMDGLNFGYMIRLNSDSTRLFISTWMPDGQSTIDYNGVYIYSCANGVNTFEHLIESPDGSNQTLFVSSVTISDTGNWLAISDSYIVTDAPYGRGKVYIYHENAGVWTLHSTIITHNQTTTSIIGDEIKLSGDGNTLFMINVRNVLPFTGEQIELLSIYKYENDSWVWKSDTTDWRWRYLGNGVSGLDTTNIESSYDGKYVFLSDPSAALEADIISSGDGNSNGAVYVYEITAFVPWFKHTYNGNNNDNLGAWTVLDRSNGDVLISASDVLNDAIGEGGDGYQENRGVVYVYK